MIQNTSLTLNLPLYANILPNIHHEHVPGNCAHKASDHVIGTACAEGQNLDTAQAHTIIHAHCACASVFSLSRRLRSGTSLVDFLE